MSSFKQHSQLVRTAFAGTALDQTATAGRTAWARGWRAHLKLRQVVAVTKSKGDEHCNAKHGGL